MNAIKIPRQIQDYLWFRYLPETTYKTYVMVGYLQQQKLKGEEASKKLLTTDFEIETEVGPMREQKEIALNKLGQKYPENRMEDIKILLDYRLINVAKDQNENLIYLHNTPLPRPEEVLNLDEEEKEILEKIKFEYKHQNVFNQLLTLLLNSNGNMLTTLDNIHSVIKVKHSDIKEVINYLIEEGSIKIKSDKEAMQLRKNDKLYLSIVKEVFEEKRFVIS
ncbi:DUF6042 family protein [Tepidibacter sp. Z1-5]|uniref:DUF6042 family protein n=1 Tax=Tepidibacter sp. Z1-5 TaxID=3134138 RepID=UPI0030C4A5E9